MCTFEWMAGLDLEVLADVDGETNTSPLQGGKLWDIIKLGDLSQMPCLLSYALSFADMLFIALTSKRVYSSALPFAVFKFLSKIIVIPFISLSVFNP